MTIAIVRELGAPNLLRFVQFFRCEQTDTINLPLLPTASGAPPLRPMIEPSSAMEWRKAFFEDAFYTLLTTALLMMLFSAVVAAID
jgi:hypothetical protein